MLFDIILHPDTHLLSLIQQYGDWVYVILFIIIFSETGLVVAPFLPGDSLLFVAGALCGMDYMQLHILMPLLMLAALSGDNTNYWIGRLIGKQLVHRANSRFFRREHLDKTHEFYKTHGGKTILFARFLPIIRTFAPFVAGIGRMSYRLFLSFSAVGSVLWIGCFVALGYFFGNIPVIKNNLTLMVFVIVIVSFLPALREFVRHRKQSS